MEYYDITGPVVLKNVTCPYCGKELSNENISVEHVIGRRFVQKGCLENQFNLILNACISCNNIKSDLEDDISAITQLNSIEYFDTGAHVKNVIKKATGAISRKTKKKVISSSEDLTIPLVLGPGISMTFGMVSKPQIIMERANQLAFMQLKALYYYQSYNETKKSGYYIPGVFVIVNNSIKSDWGNSINIQFIEIVKSWEVRMNLITANDNYKCNTRKADRINCWSWAFEWNKFYRIIGFFGDEQYISEIAKNITFPNPSSVIQNGKEVIKIFKEKKIEDKDDLLFIYPMLT